MRTTAAVLWEPGGKWEIEEVELDSPNAGEVMVELTASGLCHSDEHLVTGDLPAVLPMVGGHEGAGRVIEVGPGVTELEVGDPVVMTFLPSCGRCPYCSKGQPNLCNDGAGATSARSSTAPTGSTPAARTWARCVCSARSPGTPSSR